MRGKPVACQFLLPVRGLIPAHAGKTPCPLLMCLWPRAHPRACGENRLFSRSSSSRPGSSPRMRGKPASGRAQLFKARLIPAHAGKTFLWRPGRRAPTAHPRACGENPRTRKKPARRAGSSPRMRGKRNPTEAIRAAARLIPAHAGKTRSLKASSPTMQAHPRACGENPTTIQKHQRREGSSPRMRGKLIAGLCSDIKGRLIPAHAGKTGAHAKPGSGRSGSSPRMRGKLCPSWFLWPWLWLIPAHAGKTPCR